MAIFRLRVSGVGTYGDIWNINMHADSDETPAAAATALASAFTDAWEGTDTATADLGPQYNASITVTQAAAAVLDPTTGQQQEAAEDILELAGTADGDQLPPQVAIVVSWVTALRNRGGRGRIYLPAPATDTLSAARISTAAVTATVAAIGRMLNGLVTAGLTPIIWSPGKPSPPAIISYNVGDVFDTQRRRRDQLQEVRTSAPVPTLALLRSNAQDYLRRQSSTPAT